MKIKTGDKVIVITGKDKGNTGKVVKVLKKTDQVIVEGINMVKKHLKPDANNQNGGIIERENPIHVSNVKLADAKTTKTSKDESKSKSTKKSKEKAE